MSPCDFPETIARLCIANAGIRAIGVVDSEATCIGKNAMFRREMLATLTLTAAGLACRYRAGCPGG